MFKCGWGGQFAPAVVVVIGLSLIAAISFTAMYSEGYQAAKDDRSSNAEKYQLTEERYRECAAKPSGDEALNCYLQFKNITRDEHVAQQDLNAQQQMAVWARWMFYSTAIIGFATIAVTVVGIDFVRKTLAANTDAVNEARRANDLASANAFSERRAWLYFDARTPTLWTYADGRIGGKIVMQVRNVGNEPALNCRILHVAVSGHVYDDRQNRTAIEQLIGQSSDYYSALKFILPGQMRETTVLIQELAEESHLFPRVYIMIAYRSNTCESDKYTLVTYNVFGGHQLRVGDIGVGGAVVELIEAQSDMAT